MLEQVLPRNAFEASLLSLAQLHLDSTIHFIRRVYHRSHHGHKEENPHSQDH